MLQLPLHSSTKRVWIHVYVCVYEFYIKQEECVAWDWGLLSSNDNLWFAERTPGPQRELLIGPVWLRPARSIPNMTTAFTLKQGNILTIFHPIYSGTCLQTRFLYA